MLNAFNDYFQTVPVISILRGIQPCEIEKIGQVLTTLGNRCIEIPLNSPEPLQSIEKLVRQTSSETLCGAGTVTTVDQVQQIHDVGGKLIVSPNCNTDVIEKSLSLGMLPVPGIATPTEAFRAIEAGATMLKIFPASSIGIDFLKALKSVIPAEIGCVATGGINPSNLSEWLEAGATAAGIGSDIFKPGFSADEVRCRFDAIRKATS